METKVATVEQIQRAANGGRAPSVKSLAAFIVATFPELNVAAEQWTYVSERRTAGRRYVNSRSSREGVKVTVRDATGKRIFTFDHDGQTPVRVLVLWVADRLKEQGK